MLLSSSYLTVTSSEIPHLRFSLGLLELASALLKAVAELASFDILMLCLLLARLHPFPDVDPLPLVTPCRACWLIVLPLFFLLVDLFSDAAGRPVAVALAAARVLSVLWSPRASSRVVLRAVQEKFVDTVVTPVLFSYQHLGLWCAMRHIVMFCEGTVPSGMALGAVVLVRSWLLAWVTNAGAAAAAAAVVVVVHVVTVVVLGSFALFGSPHLFSQHGPTS